MMSLLIYSLRPMMTFLYMFLIAIATEARQYNVGEGVIPTYLYRRLTEVEEALFPFDIRINVSMTMAEGTLIYSIDRNLNQLIVTVYDHGYVSLLVEINKQQFGFSLPELCGCESGKFEPVYLWLMLKEGSMMLQCNWRTIQRRDLQTTKALNQYYVMPYNLTQSNPSLTNDAHLWLVNNPQYGRIYPNNVQISGCIFMVTYRGSELNFTEVGGKIGFKCSRVCEGDICHGGRCHETYSSPPVCNCTLTPLIGTYCNDSLHSISARTSYPYYAFSIFKLSWRSFSRDILNLRNQKVRLTLSQDGGALYMEYKNMEHGGSTTKITLCEHYHPGQEYIMIATFRVTLVDIDIRINMTWHNWALWTGKNLAMEVFESVALRSGNGTIGMAFKTQMADYHWRNMSMYTYDVLGDEGNDKENVIITIIKGGLHEPARWSTTGNDKENVIITTIKGSRNEPGRWSTTVAITALVASICGAALTAVVAVLIYKWKRWSFNRPSRMDQSSDDEEGHGLSQIQTLDVKSLIQTYPSSSRQSSRDSRQTKDS